MFRLSQFVAGMLLFCFMMITTACTCTLTPLSIHPITKERTDVFIGESKFIELQFKNEKTEGNVEVFPESPLVVINRKFNTTCSIDGGIWVRKSIFISSDESILVMQEYSGSNDSLNFYDAQTCKKINEIDVSNSTWEIRGSEIMVSKQKAVNNTDADGMITYHLNAFCNTSKSIK